MLSKPSGRYKPIIVSKHNAMKPRKGKIHPIRPLQIRKRSTGQTISARQFLKHWLFYAVAVAILIILSSWETKSMLILTGYTDTLQHEKVIRNKIPGTVLSFEAADYQQVNQGQLLYTLAAHKAATKIHIQLDKIEHYQKQIADLLTHQTSDLNMVHPFDQIKKLEVQIQELTNSNQQLYLEQRQHRHFAPMDGTLTWLAGMRKGAFIKAGKPMATLTGKDSLVSTFKVTNKQFKRLRLNQQATIQQLTPNQEKETKLCWIQHIQAIDQGAAYLISCSYPYDLSYAGSPRKTIGYFPIKKRIFPFLN